MASTTDVASTSTRTVERALGLLAEVCGAGSISLSECARRANLPTSTALRLLRTLEQAGFVARDGEGQFCAGPWLVRLGATAFGNHELIRLAHPVLQRLVAATGESAYLSGFGPGRTALYLAVVEGTHAIRHTSWVGRTLPLNGTAVGTALLGQTPPAGWIGLRSKVEPDVTAVAAPIVRPAGVAGALSIVGPTYRIDDGRLHQYGQLLNTEATALSARFEATPPNRK